VTAPRRPVSIRATTRPMLPILPAALHWARPPGHRIASPLPPWTAGVSCRRSWAAIRCARNPPRDPPSLTRSWGLPPRTRSPSH